MLDCTFGAGKTNPDGLEFQKQLNEHFFLTDPDEFIYTHFPYDEVYLAKEIKKFSSDNYYVFLINHWFGWWTININC